MVIHGIAPDHLETFVLVVGIVAVIEALVSHNEHSRADNRPPYGHGSGIGHPMTPTNTHSADRFDPDHFGRHSKAQPNPQRRAIARGASHRNEGD
jgi:hypothetical protein